MDSNRHSNPRLSIELVPSSSWGDNLRKICSRVQWDKIRKESYKRANYQCQVCGAPGRLECHEVWDYDDENKVQTLREMVALCSACHEVKHIGFASVRGRLRPALAHLAKVNCWLPPVASRYVNDQFDTWRERSRHEWTLDLSALERYGFRFEGGKVKPVSE